MGAIKRLLTGWLPGRAPPKELVRRGILHDDPSGGQHGGGRPGAESPSGNTVFSCRLSVLLERPETEGGIPRVVVALMDRLREGDNEGIRAEGVFRVPGDLTEMRELRAQINRAGDPAEPIAHCDNLHSVAGMLKMFFRELPEPLFTFGMYDEFIRFSSGMGSPLSDAELAELHGLLDQLPPGHAVLARHLMLFLAHVVSFTGENKMTVGNTAAVFAPNLLRPKHETLEHLADTVHIVNLVSQMVAAPRRVFARWGGSDDEAEAAAGAAPILSTSQRSACSHRSEPCRRTDSSVSCGGTGDTCRLSVDSMAVTSHRSVSGSDVTAEPASCSRTATASDLELEPAHVPPAATPASADWYYVDSANEQQGPVEWPSLQALFADARLPGGTYIFTEGLPNWTQANLFDLRGPEPTVGGGAQS